MNALDRQAELALHRAAQPVVVPVEMVRGRRTSGAAFTLACDASGLEDKEICFALAEDDKPFDPGTFSRIKKGSNTLPADLVATFCKVVGNTIYLEWLAYQCGYGVVMLKSEAERRAELLEEQLKEERIKTAALMDALRGSC